MAAVAAAESPRGPCRMMSKRQTKRKNDIQALALMYGAGTGGLACSAGLEEEEEEEEEEVLEEDEEVFSAEEEEEGREEDEEEGLAAEEEEGLAAGSEGISK